MQPAAAAKQQTDQRPKPRGRPWPPGVSGNPFGRTLGKRYFTLFGDLARDLGGEAALTGIQRALLGQACQLMVRSEQVRVADDAVRLANAAQRILTTLTAKRTSSKQLGPDSLRAYAASKYSVPA